MSEVRTALEAFAAGELDYGELQKRLNAALAGGVGVDEAVAELDAIRDSDGLSVGLYNVLRRAITRVSDDDDTSPFGSDATEPDRRADGESGEERKVDEIIGEHPGDDELPLMFTEPEALLDEDLPALDAVGPKPVEADKPGGDEGGRDAGADGPEDEEPTPLPSGRWLAQPGWETPEDPEGEDSTPGAESASPPGEAGIGGDSPEEPEEEGEAPLPEAGDVIGGRYVIQSILGRGGMGVVFRVRDRCRDAAGADDTDLALKLLKPELRDSEDAGRRLLAEALQGQVLIHPHLVRVLDFGEAEDMPYVTMELLDGESLRSAITRQTPEGFEPSEATRIIGGIASGLAYLHRRGYVHSDLKPGNLFLCRDGQPRLLDFGLTRRPGRAMEPVLDGADLPARTPAYASPQVLGGEAPGPRDDVFSLGCVAFEIVAGRHPFGRVPADEAMERKLRPGRIKGIPAHQRRAIRRALNFLPGRRFADADAFLAAMGLQVDSAAGRLSGFLPGALAGALAGILLTLAVINPQGFLHRLLGTGSGVIRPAASPAAPATAPVTPPPPATADTGTLVETPGG
ncbi:MAG: serine/threonine-protein kinase, partial [Gammaproteobacteria bacterium]